MNAGIRAWTGRRRIRSTEDLTKQGIDTSLARRVSQLGPMVTAIDIVQIGAAVTQLVDTVCGVYFGLDQYLSMQWLQTKTTALPITDRWRKLARNALREELYLSQRSITAGSQGRTGVDNLGY